MYFAIAIFGPFVAAAVGLDPYKLDAQRDQRPRRQAQAPDSAASARRTPSAWSGAPGRDIFAQLLFGLRISLVIATSATFITVVIGTVIGIIAGYAGGLTGQHHRRASWT